MAALNEEFKKWVNLIKTFELDEIITNLKAIKNIKQNVESDKYLFKLLLHLSHCADQCCKQKLCKENEIFTITVIICENIKKLPDKDKLFSALYYITVCLISKELFKEAKIISSYLCPGKLVQVNDACTPAQYSTIAYLWQAEIFKILDGLAKNYKTEKENINIEFKSYVCFHMQYLHWCEKKVVLKTVENYAKKLSNIPFIFAVPLLLELFKQLSNYSKDSTKCSVKEAYSTAILIMGITFYTRTDAINNADISSYFKQSDQYFVDYIKSDKLYHYCYSLFREYSVNLFETNFMSSEIGELRFRRSFELLKNLIQKYGANNDSLIQTISAIKFSFARVFANLEKFVSKPITSNTKLTHDDILIIGNFVKCVHSILKNSTFSADHVCLKCSKSTKCSVKKDIYYASTVIEGYLKIISKMKQDSITLKFLSLAKEFIDELIATFRDLDNSDCKYSVPMWDICGRMIFNIGLITEVKYPTEFVKMYKILCTQIIRCDGLNSKVSSFGLESPVATILHRLYITHFHQEKYRKAMSYIAYSALLSTQESRKKKAYDMWANIKSKVVDSNEIPELTLLECLKKDTEVVKELGINVNLDKYDLNDLCIRELKSLFLVKVNILVSMKKILAELESANSVSHYAQGVLLMCFHALQFSKREDISDYISKAIDKLTNHKSKFTEDQWLLANLQFFQILEILYKRSQTIKKQMDDANFTIKSFKMLSGKLDVQTEEKDDLPTFGGINIEVDNKYNTWFRKILTLWENVLENSNIVHSWEPTFTLETIILCGEYCRLYKFSIIEERCWKLAYKLAIALEDVAACLYVTSRSMSLRCINETWIKNANKYAEQMQNSSKTVETDIVCMFWLSMADFYCDCKKIKEAKVFLEKVKVMTNCQMLSNPKIYIYYTDILFRNYYQINEHTSQEEYCELLVDIHYLLIHLDDMLNQEYCKFWNVRFRLFSLERLFEMISNTVIPMNSLLSHYEISLHLSCTLSCAQAMGLTLRIAQQLKYFCYIDLLGTHIDDCEARLQDLEHILCLEQFETSMNANKTKQKPIVEVARTQAVRDASAVVDSSRDRGSPELKRKIFTSPNFLDHSDFCQCFYCTNIDYQQITFAATHLRAQLYSLLKFTGESLQYFNGACRIKLKLESKDTDSARQYKNYKWKRNHIYVVDVMLLMLDFSMFLIKFIPSHKEYALELIEEVRDMEAEDNLSVHLTCIFANELYFQEFIYNDFQNKLNISVSPDIPQTITNQPVSGCVTPKQQQIEKRARGRPRRRKSPQPVAIPVISISNDNDNGNSSVEIIDVVPPPTEEQPLKRTSARNVRRKILVDEPELNGMKNEKLLEPVHTTRKKSARLSGKSNG